MSTSIVPAQEQMSISTVDLLAKINEYLVAEGRKPQENGKFLAKVRDELGLSKLLVEKFSTNNPGAQGGDRDVKGYSLTPDQALLVGMRESKVIRKKVLAYIRDLESNHRGLFGNEIQSKMLNEWGSVQNAISRTFGEPENIVYAKEMNLIYLVRLGMKAATYKRVNKLPSKGVSVMSHAPVDDQIAMTALMANNKMLLLMGITDYDIRKAALETINDKFNQNLLS
jgi:hypothetical protein